MIFYFFAESGSEHTGSGVPEGMRSGRANDKFSGPLPSPTAVREVVVISCGDRPRSPEFREEELPSSLKKRSLATRRRARFPPRATATSVARAMRV